ncbi:acylphosphatase [Macrococcus hajekii]|uniref:acylphosphatase n=1 Tax=Macrococcus hajekii TaxID=198482 RepID=A0A4R6BMY4_9STAP|nr:acylphosphatase [Macrococcus hajekii]TDM03052.1 acylphosphatase [Macrococcus hajekii]GGB06170.1 acylphosphatase [Macrococcus hajekii]
MVTQHYKIFGRVQGVGFRKATVNIANNFKITGTVENVEDYVEIYVSGQEDDVKQFMDRVLKGPNMFAKISSYNHEEIDYREFDQFKQI